MRELPRDGKCPKCRNELIHFSSTTFTAKLPASRSLIALDDSIIGLGKKHMYKCRTSNCLDKGVVFTYVENIGF